MAIVIDGDGTVTGISVGGLPDGIVDAGTLATNSVDSAELIDGAVDNSHMAAMAASKLTGALPAISGANLTALNASNLGSGTLPDARFPTTLPAASAANLTAIPAANITGTLPAISGANLTGISTSNILKISTIDGAYKRASSNSWVDQTSVTYTSVDGSSWIWVSVHIEATLHFWGGTDDDALYAMELLRVSPSAATIAHCRQTYEYPNDQQGGGGDLSGWNSSSGPHWNSCPFHMEDRFQNPASSGGDIVFKVRLARAAASVFDLDTAVYSIVEYTV